VNEQGHYYFGVEFLQSVTCIGTDKPEQHTQHVQNTNQWNPQNGPTKQQYKTLKKPTLRERTDRAWFSRLLRHLVRKLSGSLFLKPGARTKQLDTDN